MVAIDRPRDMIDEFDFVFVPSFFWPPGKPVPPNVVFGWDCFITEPNDGPGLPQKAGNVLVATGGADRYGLSKIWPELMSSKLVAGTIVNWVVGPYAGLPRLPVSREISFRVLEDVVDVPNTAVATASQLAVCVYGATFFELLALSMPTVVLLPEGVVESEEVEELIAADVAMVASDPIEAIRMLTALASSPLLVKRLRKNMQKLIRAGEGLSRFSSEIEARFLA